MLVEGSPEGGWRDVAEAVEEPSNSVFDNLMETVKGLDENMKYLGNGLKKLWDNLLSKKGKGSVGHFLSELVRLVEAGTLGSIQKIFRLALDIMKHLIEFVGKFMNKKIRIPAIEWLIKKIFKVDAKIEFTMLDLVTFIPAVVITVVFKAMHKKARLMATCGRVSRWNNPSRKPDPSRPDPRRGKSISWQQFVQASFPRP